MTLLEVLYYAAASWYIAHAVTGTHGPFGIFARLREAGKGRWHGRTKFISSIHADGLPASRPIEFGTNHDGLLDCTICLVVWVALLLRFIGPNLVTDALAVAGVALWLHGFTGWRITIN